VRAFGKAKATILLGRKALGNFQKMWGGEGSMKSPEIGEQDMKKGLKMKQKADEV